MNIIAENITRRRKELNMTQRELADKLNVSDKTVSRWETGKQIPDALTMQDIARALDMSVAELYGVDDTAVCEQKNQGDKTALYKKIKRIFLIGLTSDLETTKEIIKDMATIVIAKIVTGWRNCFA